MQRCRRKESHSPTSLSVTRVGTTPSELISQAPFIAAEEKQALLRHDSCALFTRLL